MFGEGITKIEASVLKFGSNDVNPPFLEVIPCAFIVGIICGVLGGIFVIINSNMGIIRKKYITKNWLKIIEAIIFSILTTTTFYWLPTVVTNCEDDAALTVNEELVVQYDCPSG